MGAEQVLFAALRPLRRTGALGLYGSLSKAPRRMVFLYHRVGPQEADWMLPSIPLETFRRQMAFLKKSFAILSLEDLAGMLHKGARLPDRCACVTFDDGYKDTCTQAAPVLESLGIPATVFVTAGIIDSREAFWWDRVCYSIMHSDISEIELCDTVHALPQAPGPRLREARAIVESAKQHAFCETLAGAKEVERQTGASMPQDVRDDLTMRWEDVRALHDAGFEIGSHTLSHPSLRKVSHTQAEMEIHGSRDLIRKKTGIDARHFSYPHGHASDVTEKIAAVVRDAGYASACTILPTPLTADTDPYLIGRVLPEYHPEIFHAYASGLLQRLYGLHKNACIIE